jgi:hypothetical protein
MFGSKSDPEMAISIPWPARAILWLLTPLLRRVAARVIGVGFRAERIRS